jgi:hypothetical protein
MLVNLWVCPTPSCNAYYASSSARDLRTEMNHKSSMNNGVGADPFQPTQPRSRCGECAQRGEFVERILVPVNVSDSDIQAAIKSHAVVA